MNVSGSPEQVCLAPEWLLALAQNVTARDAIVAALSQDPVAAQSAFLALDTLFFQRPGASNDANLVTLATALRLTTDQTPLIGWKFADRAPMRPLRNAVEAALARPDYSQGVAFSLFSHALSAPSRRPMRRVAFSIVKNTDDAWWRYFYLRALFKASLAVPLALKWARARPDALPVLTIALGDLDVARPTEAKALAEMVSIGRTERRLLQGWGGIALARRLARTGEPTLARDVLALGSVAEEPREYRIQGLDVLAEAADAQAAASNVSDAAEDALRARLTAMVLDPEGAHRLDPILTGLKSSSASPSLINEPIGFAHGEGMILRSGVDTDIAHSEILARLLPDWLKPEEISAFCAAPPGLDENAEMIVQRESVSYRGSIGWDRINAPANPDRYITSPGMKAGVRREMRRHIVRDVTLRYAGELTVVQDSRGRVLREISHGPANFVSGSIAPAIDETFGRQKCFSLLVGYGKDNFCHFLLDRAPLLEMWLRDPSLSDHVLLIEPLLENLLRQMISILGVEARISTVPEHRAFRFGELIAFSQTQHPGHYFPGFVQDFFSRFRQNAATPHRRIFIERPRGRRGIQNDDEIHALALRRGFELLKLETLSMSDQIRAFAEAAIIAGPHGAGFANIAFCAPGTRVIEFIHRNYLTASYSISAGLLGLRYAMLLDDTADVGENDAKFKFEDLIIDAKKFDILLDILESEN